MEAYDFGCVMTIFFFATDKEQFALTRKKRFFNEIYETWRNSLVSAWHITFW